MWESVVIVLVALTTLLVVRRAGGWWLRRRARGRLEPDRILREARGVTIRVLLYGMPPMLGLNPKRTNRLRGDLLLTDDRFLIATNRGLLADLGPDRGRPFSSVRCTGPGRLVIEGARPRPDGRQGLYRFELVLDDAETWAEALRPFTKPTD